MSVPEAEVGAPDTANRPDTVDAPDTANGPGAAGEPLPRRRRHTQFFLEVVRDFAPVFLDTEVDMSAVRAHRAAARESAGVHYSTTAYVLHAAGRVLAGHPDANAAVQGPPWDLRIARYDTVAGKLTLDATLDGQRVVLGTVVPDLQQAELADIQRHIEHARDSDPQTAPEFAGIRAVHEGPAQEARLRFREVAANLELRPRLTGTFAVTSLGHRAVDSFHSVGGTTLTFGVGRVADRAVVRDGRLAVAPVMRLSMSFDHRVIDGAEAADVLTEVKEALESVGDVRNVGDVGNVGDA